MKKQTLQETIFKRILKESQEREERGRRRLERGATMAVHTLKDPRGRLTSYVYNPQSLLTHTETLDTPSAGLKRLTLNEILLGLIRIGKPTEPCNGAWEVLLSAVKNKGDGGIIYGLAYALSPTGILVADRTGVSKSAQRGWSTMKQQKGGTALDSAANPKTSDPGDDCDLHSTKDGCEGHLDLDSLNRSYESEGWEPPLLAKLQTNHDQTFSQLTPTQQQNITKTFEEITYIFFGRHADPPL
jgi:hypothetical protein